MQKKITSFDGIKINYDISTSTTKKVKNKKTNLNSNLNPYLIFIHGAGGDLTSWEKERRFFHRKGISTIAVDLRGHGKSDRPNLPKDYSLENFAKDIHEVIQTEKIQNCILIGHCFGGMITIMFHKLFPEIAKAYVLIDTTYKAPSKLKQFFKNHAFFMRIVNYILENEDVRKKHFKHVNFQRFVGSDDFDTQRIFSDITHTTFKSWLFTYENLANFDGINILKSIKKHVLIIEGKEDTIFNILKAKKIHRLVKYSTLDVIAHTNHILVLNNPEIIEEEIFTFLKSIKEFS